MIKELRKKFIIISMASVCAVLLMIAATMNIMTYVQIEVNAKESLQTLIDNNGSFPKPARTRFNFDFKNPIHIDSDQSFSTRYFVVTFDEAREIGAVNAERIPDLTADDAITFAGLALAKGKTTGAISHFRYMIAEKSYGTLIVFVDCSRDMEVFKTRLYNSVIICSIGLTAVFFLVLIFSNTAIAPVVEAYEKQKQFITDASHELKTPLAIISTKDRKSVV